VNGEPRQIDNGAVKLIKGGALMVTCVVVVFA
jgi:hypothetical protein